MTAQSRPLIRTVKIKRQFSALLESNDYFTERRPTVVDLFCGCGGVTEGLKQAGFRVVAAVDNDPVSCRTYRKNHPEVNLYESNIEDVSPEAIKMNDLKGDTCDLLVVCAPCQPFSSQNRKKQGDPRSILILQAVRFAQVLKPSLIFFENVPGIAAPRHRGVLDRLRDELSTLGYKLGKPVGLNAADYGVPQRRKRFIMFASREGIMPELPPPTTPEGARISVRMAIGNLTPLCAGEADPFDYLHVARKHSELALKRLAYIPKNGGSRFSLPPELELPCHRNYNGHPDVYGRMFWDDVAPTLTTGCTDITRGRFAHPRDDRAITLREAARLQTFRDDYIFEGCYKEIERQIGNAVPVALVRELGLSMLKVFKEAKIWR
ncbi:C-5 cytosine methyltransferase [Moorella glycerini]|uniref:Cytosine-specific methyltransferase n=1 Tax=Neomoorella stamsii TaxID=1266720 RepID=A0A9X7P763_9FIRM|nr:MULTISPECIES: DNA cytosine methyltransferase [Moorella]PRR76301.1 putative BsuMI modification methylase subunit YdiO [Moorella stamsii]CEP67131.1 C-5 cytosine methyltransferase [Moorella glycerini]